MVQGDENMERELITCHLFSGCTPAMAALILYFVVLHMMGKKQTAGHIIASFAFCYYLIGVPTMTGACLKGSFSPRIEYIPFVDMIRGPEDTVPNVLLFVPMGFFSRCYMKSMIESARLPLLVFLSLYL